ncbi:hypothetical protein ABVT39_018541 [Epinephelus coioides]
MQSLCRTSEFDELFRKFQCYWCDDSSRYNIDQSVSFSFGPNDAMRDSYLQQTAAVVEEVKVPSTLM